MEHPVFRIVVMMSENSDDQDIRSRCRSYKCDAKRIPGSDEYEITTLDPVNFFWLGLNFNNGFINKLISAR